MWFKGSGKGGRVCVWRGVRGSGEGLGGLMSANVNTCEAKAGEIGRESAVVLSFCSGKICWVCLQSVSLNYDMWRDL